MECLIQLTVVLSGPLGPSIIPGYFGTNFGGRPWFLTKPRASALGGDFRRSTQHFIICIKDGVSRWAEDLGTGLQPHSGKSFGIVNAEVIFPRCAAVKFPTFAGNQAIGIDKLTRRRGLALLDGDSNAL